MRIRIIKPHQKYQMGERVEVTRNVAFGLIDSGYAEVDKEITNQDYKTKAIRKRVL